MSTIKHEQLENIDLSPVYFSELNIIACISHEELRKGFFSYHDIQLVTPPELSMHS